MNIRYCSMNPAWVEPIKWDQNLALCRKTPHALGACSQSDTIYCTGCAQNCILLHSQRGRGDRYCRWCTHWGPTSLIVDCKTLRCIRCKRFKCRRRQCMVWNWNISHVIALAMYGGSVWLIGADGSSGRGRLHSATPGPKTLLHFWSVLSAIK